MRYLIAKEEIEDVHGRILYPGSVKMVKDKVPVRIADADDYESFHGWATDIRRDGNEVTAEVRWFEGITDKDVEWHGSTVFLGSIKRHDFKGFIFIESGDLLEVVFTVMVPWAKGYPEELKNAYR